jgi:hypothetical protein
LKLYFSMSNYNNTQQIHETPLLFIFSTTIFFYIFAPSFLHNTSSLIENIYWFIQNIFVSQFVCIIEKNILKSLNPKRFTTAALSKQTNEINLFSLSISYSVNNNTTTEVTYCTAGIV